ncbi:MAG: hypothetical protein JXR89_03735, partial [Deltaproteobacteria bacterium]|nr:hypothetical protein [Deltaproteobacteria bacterium]
MKKRGQVRYFIVLLLIIAVFLLGGQTFYRHVSHYFQEDAKYEQGLIAERIIDNLQSHLRRVADTVDSVLTFAHCRSGGVLEPLAGRFYLLWEIYPEISHLLFVDANGMVFSTDEGGRFASLGLPLEEVFEWQAFVECLQAPDSGPELRIRLTSFRRFFPARGETLEEPIVVFSKNIVFQGEYAGQVLVPYKLELLLDTYCRGLVLENKQEIFLVDNRGRVVFSSLAGPYLAPFSPAYGGSHDPFLDAGEAFPVRLDRRDQPEVIAALANRHPFSCRLLHQGPRGEREYLASGRVLELGAPDWTLLVAYPREYSDAMVLRVMLPVIISSLVFMLGVMLFSFTMLRRYGLVARENEIFRAGLRASADGVLVLDDQGRGLFVNQSCRRIVGS